ncbi:MAG: hypothetical protein NW201_13615 [Gemmatimonadales bacterium]|nr:hypothetical protein [Gemmatimonadales bacterium]
MRRHLGAILAMMGWAGGAAVLPAQTAPATAVLPPEHVALVRADTLHDVALVRLEQGRPVIYYNARLMARIGPELSTFFLAHEFGHVKEGHAGSALVERETDRRQEVIQRMELAADCEAAKALATERPDAVQEAVTFFTRMGTHRFDVQHPTGAQRAAKILACAAAARAASAPFARP